MTILLQPRKRNFRCVVAMGGTDLPPILGLADVNEGLQLLLDDGLRLAAFTLLKSLANAKNDAETGVDRRTGLLGDKGRVFVEEATALRVAYTPLPSWNS